MKAIIGVLLAAVMMLALSSGEAFARGRGGSHAHYANQGGHYAGGHGSSHKGGHYRNARTHNHYTHHKK